MRFPGKWILAVSILVLGVGTVYWFGPELWGHRHLKAAKQAVERRDFRAATIELTKHLEDYPSDTRAVLLAAQTSRRSGDYPKAAHYLETFEKQDGSHEQLDRERKLARLQRGELGGAESLLAGVQAKGDADETALVLEAYITGNLKALDSALMLEMKNRGHLEPEDFQRTHQAIDRWLELRHASADRAQGMFWKGRIHFTAREFAAAEADFREAIRLDENQVDARRVLAGLLLANAPQEALTHYEYLQKLEPQNTEIKFGRALARGSVGQLEEARQILDELVGEENNPAPKLLLERGRVALDLKQYDEAETWLRKALQRAPDYPAALLTLAECLQLAGREAEAKPYREQFQQVTDALKNGKLR